jgi:hypothetical protein
VAAEALAVQSLSLDAELRQRSGTKMLRASPRPRPRRDRSLRGARIARVPTLVALAAVLVVACSGGREESSIRGCPRPDWPGPWTACAEARWVERVVEAGGYRVRDGGGTGSALTAEGHGRGFYVWAASTGLDDSQPAADGVRTSWNAQGFTFWVESGPSRTDAKPTLDELKPVVAASKGIRPPPADE